MILHCMKKSIWEERESKEYWGQRNLHAERFLHCSTIEYFWHIVWIFEEEQDEFVIICIDEKKLESPVRYEDGDKCAPIFKRRRWKVCEKSRVCGNQR